MSSSVRLQLNHIHAKLILSNLSYHYHPQIVCEGDVFTGVCLCKGGPCPGGHCTGVGVSVGGLSPGWSLSRVISVQGGLCLGGLCLGGLCPGGSLSRGFSGVEIPTPVMVTCGQHASYWNAFFLLYCS